MQYRVVSYFWEYDFIFVMLEVVINKFFMIILKSRIVSSYVGEISENTN